MSILDSSPPPFAIPSDEEVEAFVRKIAQAVADQLGADALNSPFIRSTECAQILGITPEHLCAMRARREGPPWCGEGKWVRYERTAVHEWLRNLPRHSTSVSPVEPQPNRSRVTDLWAIRRCDHE